jgi:hypothetical protein
MVAGDTEGAELDGTPAGGASEVVAVRVAVAMLRGAVSVVVAIRMAVGLAGLLLLPLLATGMGIDVALLGLLVKIDEPEVRFLVERGEEFGSGSDGIGRRSELVCV